MGEQQNTLRNYIESDFDELIKIRDAVGSDSETWTCEFCGKPIPTETYDALKHWNRDKDCETTYIVENSKTWCSAECWAKQRVSEQI